MNEQLVKLIDKLSYDGTLYSFGHLIYKEEDALLEKPGWPTRPTWNVTWNPCARRCWMKSAKEKGFKYDHTSDPEKFHRLQ